jgi:hypothetical protein
MIYNLGAGVVILEISFDALHHQLNNHQIYIRGDNNLKFEPKRARIEQLAAYFVTTIFLSH